MATPAPMNDPARDEPERSGYARDGFTLAKGFLEPTEVDTIRAEAKAVFLRQMLRHGLVASADPADVSEHAFEQAMFRLFELDVQTFANCGKQAQHLISLHRLSLDARIVARLQAMGLQQPNISTRPVLYFNHRRLAKKEVYWRLSLHQDWRSMQGSLDSVVVWIPLVDIDTALGALEVAPGSHRRGLLDADMSDGYGHVRQPIDAAELVSVEVERGDALFFSTLLAHQSGVNVTESIRWSCHFRYNNLGEQSFIERGYPHPYVYQPQEKLITENFPSPDAVAALFR